jgi:hypothetical protein
MPDRDFRPQANPHMPVNDVAPAAPPLITPPPVTPVREVTPVIFEKSPAYVKNTATFKDFRPVPVDLPKEVELPKDLSAAVSAVFSPLQISSLVPPFEPQGEGANAEKEVTKENIDVASTQTSSSNQKSGKKTQPA